MPDNDVQASTPYSPGVPQPYVMEEFQGLFTSTTRPGVDEKQCWWIDGFMPIGRMNLRAMPGVGSISFTILTTSIVFYEFANIEESPVAIVFMADGSIWQVRTLDGGNGQIAPPGTIQNPSQTTTGLTQYGSGTVIIVTQQTNGYFIWDGNTFFSPGDSYPGGTVPTAISGNAVETYQGRVWVANGATITFSAPGSIIDFASNDGGGNFTSTDSFLRVGFTALVQTNGFLYLIGDSSINYISGVQTSGSPPVTTFTNQNADPEVGTPYPSTVNVFGRNIVFANAWGAHVSYGSAVNKISEALDGFYTSVPNFGGQQLSSAKAIIFGKKVWMMLVPVIDLFTGQQRNKLCLWNGTIWWVSEQDMALTFIQSQEINSVLTTWGTDGHTMKPLFQNPSTAFTKRVMSKFWTSPIGYNQIKNANQFWAIAQYFSMNSPNVNLYVQSENAASVGGNAQRVLVPTTDNSAMTWTTNGGQVMNWTTLGGMPMIWSALSTGIVVFPVTSVGQKGVLIGFTLETNCDDMAFISVMLGVIPAAYRGR